VLRTPTPPSVEGDCCPSPPTAGLSVAEAAAFARTFAALGDPVRLRLLSLIAAHPDSGCCVCDLVEPVQRSQPTVSHHLRVLRDAGLVTSERRGTWVWYRVVPERLAELRRILG